MIALLPESTEAQMDDATDQPTLPVSLFLRMVLCAVKDMIERTDARLHRNPNPHGAAPKAVGREGQLVRLRYERDLLAGMIRAEMKGRIRADIAALVCAVALGHAEAMRDLEDLLAASGHPAASEVVDLPMKDVTRIVQAVLGKL